MATIYRFPTEYMVTDLPEFNLIAFVENVQYPVTNAFNFDSEYAELGARYSDSEEIISYAEIKGFDFSEIPASANISDIKMYIKYRLDSTEEVSWLGYESMNYVNGEYVQIKLDNFDITTSMNEMYVDLGVSTREQLDGLIIDLYLTHTAGTNDVNFIIESVCVYVTHDAPVITIGTPSRTKISHANGCNQSVVTFQSDRALQSWEARATIEGQTIGHGSGLLVESGESLEANTDATVYVDCTELTNGDTEYTISVFGQSTDGRWSDG